MESNSYTLLIDIDNKPKVLSVYDIQENGERLVEFTRDKTSKIATGSKGVMEYIRDDIYVETGKTAYLYKV